MTHLSGGHSHKETDLLKSGGLGGTEGAGGFNRGDAHQYVTGAGAISIAFLLELLKLNTEMKNDMADLSEQTTQAQSTVIQNQADTQTHLYDAQAAELNLQMMSTIASSVTSGIQGIGSISMGIGTKSEATEASQSQMQLENYNEISTQTDLFTGDEETPGTFDEGKGFTTEEQKRDVQMLRAQLKEGRFDSSTFDGKSLSEAKMKVAGTDREYEAETVIRTLSPEERETVGKNFSNMRDKANEKVAKAQNRWMSITQLMGNFSNMATGITDSTSKGLQSDQKEKEGAASAVFQEAQGAGNILNNSQNTVSGASKTGADNISLTLQTLREIVNAQVKG